MYNIRMKNGFRFLFLPKQFIAETEMMILVETV